MGITAAQIAKNLGATVLPTTRSTSKQKVLEDTSVDHIIIDQGEIAKEVKSIYPKGIDKVLELIGGNGIRDSLSCTKKGGIVCQTGYLSGQWRIDGFSPLGEIPSGVYLTSYAGENSNLPANLLQDFIDQVESNKLKVKIDKVFSIDQIVEAHEHMENNKVSGKLVVRNNH